MDWGFKGRGDLEVLILNITVGGRVELGFDVHWSMSTYLHPPVHEAASKVWGLQVRVLFCRCDADVVHSSPCFVE